MFKKIKITCDKATTYCDKVQYGEASVKEIILLNIHLLTCKICLLYSKQNKTMSRIYKVKSNSCQIKNECLTSRDKQELKKKFKQFK